MDTCIEEIETLNQQFTFNVRNDEGVTIPLGAPLYSKGEIGGSNRIKVGIADASNSAKMPAIGIAMEELNTTSTKNGNAIASGILNENINSFLRSYRQ